jgi:hypothetical protein
MVRVSGRFGKTEGFVILSGDLRQGDESMKTAIACASGSIKGVFVHGVLDAFREHGLAADAYDRVVLLTRDLVGGPFNSVRNPG